MREYNPHSHVSCDPVFAVAFNLRIDPEKVINLVKFKTGNLLFGKGNYAPPRLATSEEIQNSSVKEMWSKYEGYVLVFKSTKPFPGKTNVKVTIGPKIPTTEGPLLSTKKITFQVSTMETFKITSFYPSNGIARAAEQLLIRCNHSFDESKNDLSRITIDPPLPNFRVKYV